jgi:hypothetical protein
MQTVIREQVDALLRLGVIEASHAPIWSQVRIVPKPDGKWRFALDFIRLIALTIFISVGGLGHMITLNSSRFSHCCLIWDCFSTECVRGGSLCMLDFHFVSSILMDMGGMSAGSARTAVSKMSEYSSHRARNFCHRLGGPCI